MYTMVAWSRIRIVGRLSSGWWGTVDDVTLDGHRYALKRQRILSTGKEPSPDGPLNSSWRREISFGVWAAAQGAPGLLRLHGWRVTRCQGDSLPDLPPGNKLIPRARTTALRRIAVVRGVPV
jgi:hypothetical protein